MAGPSRFPPTPSSRRCPARRRRRRHLRLGLALLCPFAEGLRRRGVRAHRLSRHRAAGLRGTHHGRRAGGGARGGVRGVLPTRGGGAARWAVHGVRGLVAEEGGARDGGGAGARAGRRGVRAAGAAAAAGVRGAGEPAGGRAGRVERGGRVPVGAGGVVGGGGAVHSIAARRRCTMACLLQQAREKYIELIEWRVCCNKQVKSALNTQNGVFVATSR